MNKTLIALVLIGALFLAGCIGGGEEPEAGDQAPVDVTPPAVTPPAETPPAEEPAAATPPTAAEMCGMITDDELEVYCDAVIEEDPAVCNDASDINTCLLQVGEAYGDTSVCESITSQTIRFDCYQAVAVTTKNTDPCMDITKTTMQTSREQCVLAVAVASHNKRVCNEMPDLDYADIADCNNTYTIRTNTQASKCQAEEIQVVKDNCWKYLGIQTRTVSYCGSITDSSKKQECVEAIAAAAGDGNICQNTAGRDACYLEVVKAMQ